MDVKIDLPAGYLDQGRGLGGVGCESNVKLAKLAGLITESVDDQIELAMPAIFFASARA